MTTPSAAGLPPTLMDPDAQRQFDELGFAVVDFLAPETAAHLAAVCRGIHPAATTTWECDFYDEDPQVKETVGREIQAAFAEPMRRHFVDHRTFLHNFVVNWPGDDGGIELHEHSSTVDERLFRSAVVWCALNDATEANGTLHVVPASHRLQRVPKAERGPQWFEGYVDELLARHLDSVALTAGQALVFDNALLHCSFSNVGTEPRLTAVATVAPTTAELRYYSWVGDGTIEAYELVPEFFTNNVSANHEWALPEGLRPVEVVPADTSIPTANDLASVLPEGHCAHRIEVG